MSHNDNNDSPQRTAPWMTAGRRHHIDGNEWLTFVNQIVEGQTPLNSYFCLFAPSTLSSRLLCSLLLWRVLAEVWFRPSNQALTPFFYSLTVDGQTHKTKESEKQKVPTAQRPHTHHVVPHNSPGHRSCRCSIVQSICCTQSGSKDAQSVRELEHNQVQAPYRS